MLKQHVDRFLDFSVHLKNKMKLNYRCNNKKKKIQPTNKNVKLMKLLAIKYHPLFMFDIFSNCVFVVFFLTLYSSHLPMIFCTAKRKIVGCDIPNNRNGLLVITRSLLHVGMHFSLHVLAYFVFQYIRRSRPP